MRLFEYIVSVFDQNREKFLHLGNGIERFGRRTLDNFGLPNAKLFQGGA